MGDILELEEVCDFEDAEFFDLQVFAFLHYQVALVIAGRELDVFRVLGNDPLTELAGVQDQASAVGASNGCFEGVTPRSCTA